MTLTRLEVSFCCLGAQHARVRVRVLVTSVNRTTFVNYTIHPPVTWMLCAQIENLLLSTNTASPDTACDHTLSPQHTRITVTLDAWDWAGLVSFLAEKQRLVDASDCDSGWSRNQAVATSPEFAIALAAAKVETTSPVRISEW